MIKELRNKSTNEIKSLIVELKSKLMQMRFDDARGASVKPHLFKEIKKAIAQSHFVLGTRNEKMTSQDYWKYMMTSNDQSTSLDSTNTLKIDKSKEINVNINESDNI